MDTNRLFDFLTECLSVGCIKGFKYFDLYPRGREELLLRVYKDWEITISRHPSSRDLSNHASRKLLWASTDNLPPASPCDREIEMDSRYIAFLIAGYARYKSPFVWLRNNHNMFNNSKPDDPLKLNTLNRWKNMENVPLVDVISELVAQSTNPTNPLQVDHDYFNNLPLQESIVCIGAMLNLLKTVYLNNPQYDDLTDIELLARKYFANNLELYSDNKN